MPPNYIYEKIGRHPVKHWTKGVPLDDRARDQLHNTASLPFIHKHVAAMPDVHWGMGATIGSVIATKGAIVPAAVGVDIGCGMMAVKTTLNGHRLPDDLHTIRCDIEQSVPHGRTNNGGKGDIGSWRKLSGTRAARWNRLKAGYEKIITKHPQARSFNNALHIGTLGTGNHFIEVCLDEANNVWVMLHSGSRGAGNRIGMYFIEMAKKEMERYYIAPYLPDQNLAYLVEHTEIFNDYVYAVSWAQEYALENRKAMMEATLSALGKRLTDFSVTQMAVNCHHNYVAQENHFNSNVWVTRKGAVRARKNDLGIIPGSMGTGSFIVKGLGNKDSFCSCSHGAGRVMSRGEARSNISLANHTAAMQGIEARLDEDILDESPAAYKDIGAVMEAQSDLVEIVHRLKPIINVKG